MFQAVSGKNPDLGAALFGRSSAAEGVTACSCPQAGLCFGKSRLQAVAESSGLVQNAASRTGDRHSRVSQGDKVCQDRSWEKVRRIPGAERNSEHAREYWTSTLKKSASGGRRHQQVLPMLPAPVSHRAIRWSAMMGMSDDQIAILGSLAALAFCGVLMALSYHFGASGKQQSAGRPAVSQQPAGRQKPAADRRAA